MLGISMGENSINAMVAIRISKIRFKNLYMSFDTSWLMVCWYKSAVHVQDNSANELQIGSNAITTN